MRKNNKKINGLITAQYDESDFKLLVKSDGNWCAGILNGSNHNNIPLEFMERHPYSDELFVLLDGMGNMLMGGNSEIPAADIKRKKLQQGTLFLVEKGYWHNTILSPDAKILIVENKQEGINGFTERFYNHVPYNKQVLSIRENGEIIKQNVKVDY